MGFYARARRRTTTAATATAKATATATIAAAMALTAALVTGCDRHTDDAKGSDTDPAGYATVSAIPESIALDGTTIRVGSPQATTVVQVYEDLRCPVCREFETRGGASALREMVMTGTVRVEYTLASFLDGNLGGHGSVKAANALRAALDQGKFVEYHEVLYAHQPEEAVDGYTDAFLLEMASRVGGLRGPAFDAAVKGMKYRDFVTSSEKAFDTSGAQGTPAVKVNGKLLEGSASDALFDPAQLPLLIAGMTS